MKLKGAAGLAPVRKETRGSPSLSPHTGSPVSSWEAQQKGDWAALFWILVIAWEENALFPQQAFASIHLFWLLSPCGQSSRLRLGGELRDGGWESYSDSIWSRREGGTLLLQSTHCHGCEFHVCLEQNVFFSFLMSLSFVCICTDAHEGAHKHTHTQLRDMRDTFWRYER